MDQLADVLQRIADKLGLATVYLWPEMVRYTWAKAVADCVVSILVLIGLGIGTQQAVRAGTRHVATKRAEVEAARNSWDRYREVDNFDLYIFGTIGAAIAVVVVIICLTAITHQLPALIAPEGATITRLLRAGS